MKLILALLQQLPLFLVIGYLFSQSPELLLPLELTPQPVRSDN
jgi:LytS/YehU family sensor histidine kinase